MAELAARLAERSQDVEARGKIFQSETPPQACVLSPVPSTASCSPQDQEQRWEPWEGKVRRRSLALEEGIQPHRTLSARLNSASSRLESLSCKANRAAMIADLDALESGFSDILATSPSEFFQAQILEWLELVEGLCGNADERLASHGWRLLGDVITSRTCRHRLCSSMANEFVARVGRLFCHTFCEPPFTRVGDVVSTLVELSQTEEGMDIVSRMFLVGESSLLHAVTRATAEIFERGGLERVAGQQAVMQLWSRIADGEILLRSCREDACVAAASSISVLLGIGLACRHECDGDALLIAVAHIALVAGQARDTQFIEVAVGALNELLIYTKRATFADLNARIKFIRGLRALVDTLLSNVSLVASLRAQVATLGIPAEGVAVIDVTLIWWVLLPSPEMLGVDVQTTNRGLSKRLRRACVLAGLVERLAKISSDTEGDCTVRCHAWALLVALRRSEAACKSLLACSSIDPSKPPFEHGDLLEHVRDLVANALSAESGATQSDPSLRDPFERSQDMTGSYLNDVIRTRLDAVSAAGGA